MIDHEADLLVDEASKLSLRQIAQILGIPFTDVARRLQQEKVIREASLRIHAQKMVDRTRR